MALNRAQRISGEIHALLSELIRREVKDPRVGFVSITNVEVTNDLSLARVYVLPLGGDGDVEGMQKGLRKASGFLRRLLGKRMRLRHIPELRFIVDENHQQAVELIRTLAEQAGAREPDGEE
ncbi:MAG: 30S ribosome-binding factor RbfA [Myxococcota bacterium]